MIVPLNFIEIDSAGLAVVAGKGVPVGKLLMDKWAYDMDPEMLVKKWPTLTLAEVHAALAYYYSHQEEVDGQIERIDREQTIRDVREALASIDRGDVYTVDEVRAMVEQRYGRRRAE
jgi:uncharacterized protein (DUF433 family)